MPSTGPPLPVTRSRQNRATVRLLSTPLQEHGRTSQTRTSTVLILITVTVTDDEGHTETQVISLFGHISR